MNKFQLLFSLLITLIFLPQILHTAGDDECVACDINSMTIDSFVFREENEITGNFERVVVKVIVDGDEDENNFSILGDYGESGEGLFDIKLLKMEIGGNFRRIIINDTFVPGQSYDFVFYKHSGDQGIQFLTNKTDEFAPICIACDINSITIDSFVFREENEITGNFERVVVKVIVDGDEDENNSNILVAYGENGQNLDDEEVFPMEVGANFRRIIIDDTFVPGQSYDFGFYKNKDGVITYFAHEIDVVAE